MKGDLIEFPSNGDTASGYLVGAGPGVIVIQEWWGLNDQIKGVADRFADLGFTALAPDLYHGKAAAIGEPDEAGKLMMALDIDRAARDVQGAATFLYDETAGQVGVIGFCMGGQLALLTGCVASEEVSAVVDMYGVHPAVHPDYSTMNAAVLGLFAGNDGHVDAEVVAALTKQLDASDIRFQMHTYDNVDHGFMNEQRPDAYSSEAAEDAWKRIVSFFREHIG